MQGKHTAKLLKLSVIERHFLICGVLDSGKVSGQAWAMSSATTNGVIVTVSSAYLSQYSLPESARFVFAYTVVIQNNSSDTFQLRSRHWIITDGRGQVEEVRGEGVVGEQPQLGPGQAFQYTSGCVLETPRGTMHGAYQMHSDDGTVFDAEIAPFVLSMPGASDGTLLN